MATGKGNKQQKKSIQQKLEEKSKQIKELEKDQHQEDDDDIKNEEFQEEDEYNSEDMENLKDEFDEDELQEDDEENDDEEDDNEQEIVHGEEDDEMENMKFDDDEQLDGAACDDEQQQEDEQDDEEGGLLTDKQQIEQNLLNTKLNQADSAIVNIKIQEITKILCKFKELRDPERTRQSYLEELNGYLCNYYSYNKELMGLFQQMFNPNELLQFLEANEQKRVLTVRTNTLKTRRKELAQILIQRGVNLDPLAEWSKVGLKIYDSKIPVGATPEYLAGHYMLQSASSFLPVIALAPQVNERVLDMAAAPGGKTSYIAQLMKNTGTVFANDVKADRLKGLIFNIQRLGINNTVVCNYDGRKFPKVMKNFDRVLLDAPCTGLGIISRDPQIKANKLMIDVYKHAHLQRELLLSAIDCCKKGGYVVYSTCSVSPQENEAVVNYALNNRYIKIVECGVDVGEPGLTKFLDKRYHLDLKKSRRIYPHIHNMDGFYLCKIKKLENGSKHEKQKVEDLDELEEQLAKRPKKNRSKQLSKKQEKDLLKLKQKIKVLKGQDPNDLTDEEEEKEKKKEQQQKNNKKFNNKKFSGKKPFNKHNNKQNKNNNNNKRRNPNQNNNNKQSSNKKQKTN